MNWTTPEQLQQQVRRRWDRRELLAARALGTTLFPLRLRLAKPSPRELSERFDDVRRWVSNLIEESREKRGYGYVIEWREARHRVHGRNRVPDAVFVPSEADALKLIGRVHEANRFDELWKSTTERFPELREWLARKPLVALEHAADWPRILAVLSYLCRHTRPGRYLRQLEIPEVDTKFMEKRKALLTELLDRVLPDEAVDRQATGARNFERRYGLKTEAPLVRFRILDPRLYVQGLSDLSVLPEQFANLQLPLQQVFITENKTNGLAFPDVPGALVVFGLGYGLERLADIAWLHAAHVWYWGDIDTHGFKILDQLRARLPRVQSFLMDRDTLMAHRRLWGKEAAEERFEGALARLTDAERSLFDDLKCNRLGERLRLEQERIGYQWVRRGIDQVVSQKALTCAY